MRLSLLAAAIFAFGWLGIGCQTIAGIQQVQEEVTCVNNSQCPSSSTCLAHKCVDNACPGANCDGQAPCSAGTASASCAAPDGQADASYKAPIGADARVEDSLDARVEPGLDVLSEEATSGQDADLSGGGD